MERRCVLLHVNLKMIYNDSKLSQENMSVPKREKVSGTKKLTIFIFRNMVYQIIYRMLINVTKIFRGEIMGLY